VSVSFIFSPEFRALDDIPCIRREYFPSAGGKFRTPLIGSDVGPSVSYVILTEARRTRTLKGPVVACFQMLSVTSYLEY